MLKFVKTENEGNKDIILWGCTIKKTLFFFFFRIRDTWYRKTGLRYPAGEVAKEWGLSSEMRERMKNGYSYGKV